MSRATGRTGRPTLRESVALKEALLANALDLLCAHGPNGFTMDGLAVAAGVTKRTIYRHFKTKDLLVEAVVAHQFDKITDVVGLSAKQAVDPLSVLETWSRTWLSFTFKPDIRRFVTFSWFESMSDPDVALKMCRWTSRNVEYVISLVIEAQNAGRIRSGDPTVFAVLLIDMINGPAYRQMSCFPEDLIFASMDEDAFFASRWECYLKLVTD